MAETRNINIKRLSRFRIRSALVKHELYTKVDSFERELENFPKRRHFIINLLEGHAFPMGSTHFKNMHTYVQHLVSVVLNSKSHMTGEKIIPTSNQIKSTNMRERLAPIKILGSDVPQSKLPRFKARVYLETLFSSLDTDGPKKCTGYRLHIVSSPEERPSFLQPNGGATTTTTTAAATEAEEAPPPPVEEEADDIVDEEAEVEIHQNSRSRSRTTARGRGGRRQGTNRPSATEAEEARRNKHLERLYDMVEDAPVSYGIFLSCLEASRIQEYYTQIRVEDFAPLANNIAYRWTDHLSSEHFHFDIVQNYFSRSMQSPAAISDPAFNQFMVDRVESNRRQLDENRLLDNNDALCIDTIFTKERAMFYPYYSMEMLVNVVQKDLAYYAPDIQNYDDCITAEGRRQLKSFYHAATGKPKAADSDMKQVLYTSLFYKINDLATFAEILLPHMPLPYAIGAEIPSVIIENPLDASYYHLPYRIKKKVLDIYLTDVASLAELERVMIDDPDLNAATSAIRVNQQQQAIIQHGAPCLTLTQVRETIRYVERSLEERLQSPLTNNDPDNHDHDLMDLEDTDVNDFTNYYDITCATIIDSHRICMDGQRQVVKSTIHELRKAHNRFLYPGLIQMNHNHRHGKNTTNNNRGRSSSSSAASGRNRTINTILNLHQFPAKLIEYSTHDMMSILEFSCREDQYDSMTYGTTVNGRNLDVRLNQAIDQYQDYNDRIRQTAEKDSVEFLIASNFDLPAAMQSAVAQRDISDHISVFPQWIIDRNAFVAARQTMQMSYALMAHRHRLELAAVNQLMLQADQLADREERDEELKRLDRHLVELKRLHVAQCVGWDKKAYEDIMKTIMETQLASNSWIAGREYFKNQILPNAKSIPTNIKAVPIDARSFGGYWQRVIDEAVYVDKCTPQAMPLLLRILISMMHAHRWMVNRSDPAMNYLAAGETAFGKSFCLTRAAMRVPPGIVMLVAGDTQAAFNVDDDFDNQIRIYEEFPTSYMVGKTNPTDQGESDRVNQLKNRWTAFETTWTYHDPDGNGRHAVESHSSQHNVTLGATNQNLTHLNSAIQRRMIVDMVMEMTATVEGGKASELNSIVDDYSHTILAQQVYNINKELHVAYMFTETMIKAGVMPDVCTDGADVMLNAILNDVTERHKIEVDKKTKMTWTIEAARTLTIQHACYLALYSHEAACLYDPTPGDGEDPNDVPFIERWSPEMFRQLISPNLVVTKDMLILATTMFDKFFLARNDMFLLGTIARVANLHNPSRWSFYVRPETVDSPATTDYNYVVIRGSNKRAIAEQIALEHQNVGKQRTDDIEAMLHEYMKVTIDSHGVEPEFGNDNTCIGVKKIRSTDSSSSYKAMRFEFPSVSSSRRQALLLINIEYIFKRFNIPLGAMTANDLRDKFSPMTHQVKDVNFGDPGYGQFNASDIEKGKRFTQEVVGVCSDSTAPLVASIRTALSTTTLEASPYEHETLLPVPPQVFKYATFYPPDDTIVDIKNGKQMVRIAHHGVPSILKLERRANNHLSRENFIKPLPTARVMLYGADHETKSASSMSRGYVFDTYDIDFTMMTKRASQVWFQGLPRLEKYFIKDCIEDVRKNQPTIAQGLSDEEILRFLREKISAIDLLFDTPLPPTGRMNTEREARIANLLSGGGSRHQARDPVPLPVFYPPIFYRIRRQLRPKTDIVFDNYPGINIFERIQDTVLRKHCINDNNSPLADGRVFESVTTTITDAYFNTDRIRLESDELRNEDPDTIAKARMRLIHTDSRGQVYQLPKVNLRQLPSSTSSTLAASTAIGNTRPRTIANNPRPNTAVQITMARPGRSNANQNAVHDLNTAFSSMQLHLIDEDDDDNDSGEKQTDSLHQRHPNNDDGDAMDFDDIENMLDLERNSYNALLQNEPLVTSATKRACEETTNIDQGPASKKQRTE